MNLQIWRVIAPATSHPAVVSIFGLAGIGDPGAGTGLIQAMRPVIGIPTGSAIVVVRVHSHSTKRGFGMTIHEHEIASEAVAS